MFPTTIALCLALAGGEASTDPALVRALASHIQFLADPALRGRASGTQEGALAARYVASGFVAAGLSPVEPGKEGLEGYLVPIPVVRAILDRERCSARLLPGLPGKEEVTLLDGTRMLLAPGLTDPARVDAEVVFAGYGIRAPEFGYEDYGGLDVNGKAVLVMDHEPREKEDGPVFRGKMPSRHSLVATKAELARSLGAVALFVAADPLGGHPPIVEAAKQKLGRQMEAPALVLRDAPRPIPVLYIDDGAAGTLLGGTGKTLADIQKGIDADLKPSSFPIPGARVAIEPAVKDRVQLRIPNVIGLLPGSDPKLREEAVVIGAHYDHLGTAPDGTVFRGADDNASGVAALLETARRLASAPKKPGRTIVFVSFAAEESGTLGSLAYVKAPAVPLEKTLAAIDLDMLGRNNMGKPENRDVALVFWSAQSPWLPPVVRAAGEGTGLDLRLDGYARFGQQSDHASFHSAGVPTLFYFTGWHDDYHAAGDVPGKLDLGKTARIVGMLEKVLVALGRLPRPAIPFDRSIQKAPPGDAYEKPY